MLGLNSLALVPHNPIEVEEATGGSESMTLDGRPGAILSHVPDQRIGPRQFLQADTHVYQDLRSITLRRWKRVDIKLTGAPVTHSISFMTLMVVSVS